MLIYEEGEESIIFPWKLFLARSRMAPLYVAWNVIKFQGEAFDYVVADFALLFTSQRRWKELYVYDDVCFCTGFFRSD